MKKIRKVKRRTTPKPLKKTPYLLLDLTQEEKKRYRVGKYFPFNLPPIIAKFIKSGNPSYSPLKDFELGNGFFIHGPAGAGKSCEAACMLIDIAIQTNKRGYWVNTPKLLNDIKKGFGNREGEDLIEKYSKTPILCLDDLGSEQSTAWAMPTIYLIINSRYENMLTTIITSNLNLSELSKKMEDDRLASRIAGMCNQIEMDEEDKRL